MEIMNTSCCGVNEIEGVSLEVPETTLKHFLEDRQYSETPVKIYTFTDAKPPRSRKPSMGDNFADYIEKEKLGTVVRSKYHLNPNSGNLVRVFVWTTSKKLEKLYESFCLRNS